VIATGGFQFVAVEGDPSAVQTVATFTDPGGAEGLDDYSAVIDWGDGTTSAGTITAGLGGVFTVSGSHTYAVGLGTPSDFGNTFCDADPPSYHKTITVTISHEEAPTAQAVSDAKISLKPGSAHLASDGSLIVVGTPGNDTIVLNNVGSTHDTVTVQLGSATLGTFTVGPGRIVVAAMGGADMIQVASGVRVESVLYGGPGNDRIKGGGARNILVGCEGDDSLSAGNLGDLMIGGAGADRLVGGNKNDILVAGILVDGADAEDDQYDDLVAILNAGTIPAPLHVADDGAVDRLTGSSGIDTFYYNFAGGGVLDIVTDTVEIGSDI
jgi:Ca2+-binding RTX toxin-like protein